MKIIFSLVFSSLFLFAAQDPLPMINLSVAAVDQPIQFVKTINIAVILALMANNNFSCTYYDNFYYGTLWEKSLG